MKFKSIVASCLLLAGIGLPLRRHWPRYRGKGKELDGPKLTCVGAEKAGTPAVLPSTPANGSATGRESRSRTAGTRALQGREAAVHHHAQNMAQYVDKLTEGQKALLKKYPQSYKMLVYPSHRDFRFVDWMCPTVKKNATTSEVVHDGLGITGITGAIPFPFPASGLEAVWNMANPHRAWTEKVLYDVADVYANGSIAWARTAS